jgi:hypothetical protein
LPPHVAEAEPGSAKDQSFTIGKTIRQDRERLAVGLIFKLVHVEILSL